MSCDIRISKKVPAKSQVEFKDFVQRILDFVPMDSFCSARIRKAGDIYLALIIIRSVNRTFLTQRRGRSLGTLMQGLQTELMKQVRQWRQVRFSHVVDDVFSNASTLQGGHPCVP